MLNRVPRLHVCKVARELEKWNRPMSRPSCGRDAGLSKIDIGQVRTTTFDRARCSTIDEDRRNSEHVKGIGGVGGSIQLVVCLSARQTLTFVVVARLYTV